MSSEDFKSLVVTDPDLVDPEIDVSGLRTQTDTNPRLLGSIPDFPGVKYDPTSFDYLRDLNELFAFGLPTIETDQAQIPGAIDTLVDTGGGGQATTSGGVDTLTTPKNTLEQDRLVDQGIGVQLGPGAPVVAPGEIPVTQAEIDAFNAPAILDSTSTAEDILQDLSNQQAMLNPTGGNIMDEVALTGGIPDTNIIAPSGDVFAADDPLAIEKIDFQTPEQKEGFLQNVLGRAGQTVEGALNELSKVPGAIVDFANQTIDIFGQKLNVGKTLASAAVNKLVGGPISLVFDLLPEDSLENKTSRSIVDELKAEKDYGFNIQSGNLNQDPFGRNPVSAFGDYEQTLKDDILGINQTGFQTAEMREKKKEFAQDYFDKKAEKASGVEIDEGTVLGPGEAPGDITTLGEQLGQIKEEADVEAGLPTSTVETFTGPTMADVSGDGDRDTGLSGPPSGPGEASADAGFADTGGGDTGSVSTAGQAGPPSQRGGGADMGSVSTAGQAGPPSQRGGDSGGSSGGGKIVCTMMNESYGFGSFRNKIWLRHSKGLAPEYQKGYHKIFLPLVKLSKKNTVLKKILEHIAVHRTIDIRQESRGKVHLLGRLYRKILEPICYWVGKHG